MAAPLDVNREAVKTLALAIGVRAAARECGLKETTVRQWSMREKWFPKAVPLPPTMKNVTGVTTSPADAMQRIGERSRLALAKAGEKAAKTFEAMNGRDIIAKSAHYKNITSAKSQLHGWEQRGASGGFTLNVLNLGSLDVEIDKPDDVQEA